MPDLSKLSVFLFILFSHQLCNAQAVIWELGAGLGDINAPLYPGTNERKNYLLPYPYLKLETDYIKIDKGIQAYLFKSQTTRLDITLDLGFPVNSDDSTLRAGMEKLNTVFQIGPSLEITLQGGKKEPAELRLEFPLRTAIASDIKNTENIGWLFEPRLSYEKNRLSHNSWTYSVTAGLRYATRDYHAYYYDVEPQYTTAQRPVFYSDKGFTGYLFDASSTYRNKKMIYWLFVRHMNLKDSEYENSPLVNDSSYFMFGMGVTWIITGNKYKNSYLF
ncbi:MAG: MipA/OmpV family protein [Gammaproteobacteria bacterium]|nr:MipA/OmpV family protein [Gammaproteobacteria bacterium]MCW8911660.1 MipA/OmpV family protein [Gammaproteobacteria bacterium]MCW9004316.1 MipA/OmpV family protein [Gammaproteobacteria bacterium]MCW9056077.1 MipA/OmpV family protein [Gammaproteobacteria bacterium]